MPVTLTIRDETSPGKTDHELTLDFLTERITVRELIRSRVYQEVKDHNVQRAQGGSFRGLVQPSDEERALNEPQERRPRQIDWKRQFEVAQRAFRKSGFLILVDDRQVTELDQEIVIEPGTQVTFLKLVPLVGG